jgi:hypothetical protein
MKVGGLGVLVFYEEKMHGMYARSLDRWFVTNAASFHSCSFVLNRMPGDCRPNVRGLCGS